MKIFILMLLFVLIASTGGVFAQSRKKQKESRTHQQPNSVNPYFPQVDYSPQAKGKKAHGITYNAEAKYYKNLDAVAKSKRKAEKEMLKPQYADPTYFGHKKKPKRHKPSKMKFCKECGIRH